MRTRREGSCLPSSVFVGFSEPTNLEDAGDRGAIDCKDFADCMKPVGPHTFHGFHESTVGVVEMAPLTHGGKQGLGILGPRDV